MTTKLMARYSWKSFFLIKILLVLLSIAITNGDSDMAFSRWPSGDPTHEPIASFFRRQDVVPIRAPTFKCECPPNKECVIDYKINEDAGDFLNLRGVMNGQDLKTYREEVEYLKENEQKKSKQARKNLRRNVGLIQENECCCPPRTIQMPVFITDKLYDQQIARMTNITSEYARH